MPYEMRVTRKDPSCVLFLLDQSGSMDAPFGEEPERRKCEGAADAINAILRELIRVCTRGTPPELRHYFDVGVIGYGSKEDYAGSAFDWTHEILVPIIELAKHSKTVKKKVPHTDEEKGVVVEVEKEVSIWFEPIAYDGTPMCKAFSLAYDTIKEWVEKHPKSFPPVVVNITDGESTDGDPTPHAKKLMELSTEDGNVLLFNCHISSVKGATKVIFPADISEVNVLGDPYASLLFDISSELPDIMLRQARELGYRTIKEGARGFSFNAGMVELVHLLRIGTLTRRMQ